MHSCSHIPRWVGKPSATSELLAAGFRVDELIYAGYTEAELTSGGVDNLRYAAGFAVQKFFIDCEKPASNINYDATYCRGSAGANGGNGVNGGNAGASSGEDGGGGGGDGMTIIIIIAVGTSMVVVLLVVYCICTNKGSDSKDGGCVQ